MPRDLWLVATAKVYEGQCGTAGPRVGTSEEWQKESSAGEVLRASW